MTPGETDETWLDLEKLAERIYRELEPGSVVRHDVLLRGDVSEVDRQIDVLIENPDMGTRVVVDCKDWKRRVNVNDAAAFAGLLEDVGATSGVLICNRGFSKATRTVAKKKGFSLARLHDVQSRKWRLDVLIPIIWTRLELNKIGISFRVRLNGTTDAIETNKPPAFRKDGEPVDVAAMFEHDWNTGVLHGERPGRWQADAVLDVEIADGVIKPDAQVTFEYDVRGTSRLGYVTPQHARGIFDEETEAFTTAHFDVGETIFQEPQGGWQEVFDPEEVAVRLAGTAVTVAETAGVKIELGAVESVGGAEPHNRHLRWTRPPS